MASLLHNLKNKELSLNKKMEMTCGDSVAQWSVITEFSFTELWKHLENSMENTHTDVKV